MMSKFNHIVINKNRGWRGLAQVIIEAEHNTIPVLQMIFSFSPAMWEDLLDGYIVVQDSEYYYVIRFNDIEKLPKPTQQRSVLIKNFVADILSVNQYNKSSWQTYAKDSDWWKIHNFTTNKNTHTTSDWNCIGIRVYPII